jgi:hypothetical protein|tara:strand:- start:2054 stop:2392 length:339 start_codon:yes stop_codon:yes gene_type:complete
MNAFQDALDFYRKIEGNLLSDIAAYATLGGYVFVTPQSLMFGKAVRRDGGNPDDQWNVTAPDAWYVRFAAGEGSMQDFIEKIPYPLPYVGWARRLKDRPAIWFDYDKVLRRK